MTAYIIRRMVTAVIVTIGIALLTFIMIHAFAPSPGRAVLGDKASALAVATFNKANGYDRPVWDQFISYLNQLIHGNLGYSYKLNQTVNSLFNENWPRSAYLAGISLFLAVAVAIPLGIYQALKRNTFRDQALTGAAFTLYAMPDNFLGLLLIALFAIKLGWFPAEASQSESVWQNILDVHSMFLPIVTLMSTSVAGYSRYMRSSALDALAQDYIRLARAKGLSERAVLRKHLFRNASLAMVTLIGLSIPALLGGDLIEENLFNFHGLGLLFVNELNNEDFPTVIALVLIGGILTVIGNLVADVALSVADPRIRIAREEREMSVVVGEAPGNLPPPLPEPEGGHVQGPRSGWQLAFSSFIENKLAVAGLAIVLFFLILCFVAPLLYHGDTTVTNFSQFDNPGAGHPLGTDGNGFDELALIMIGGRASIEIGVLSSLIATVIGTLVGAIAGLVGGILDAVLMRIVDVMLSVPLLFVILIISAHYGSSVLHLSLILGAFSWLGSARLVRGEVLTLRVRDFVLAARTMGASRRRLIYQHLIPNSLSVVIVNATFQVADAIIALAFLGFLGFGLAYPVADWGDMLSKGLDNLQNGYWWLVYPVGGCLVLVVMAFNFIGDAWRDTVDVRLRRR